MTGSHMSAAARRLTALPLALLVGTTLTGTLMPSRATTAPADAPMAWCAERCEQVVLDWNSKTIQVLEAADGYANPLVATRVLAIVHLAMHDAANTAVPRFSTYRARKSDTSADAAVAAAAAAHTVLARLYPKHSALVDPLLQASLHDASKAPSAIKGVDIGKAVAEDLLSSRASDGSAGSEPYKQGTRPGEYRFTPGFDFALMPHWRQVRPFVLQSNGQFRTAPPPALGSQAYALAFNEVKQVGAKSGATRSQSQSEIAAFWYEFSDIGWNRIARVAARTRAMDLWSTARTFALLNVAMADSYIAGWDSKVHFNFWRPVTAIRQAADDGNSATEADASWESFLATPPIMDHPSTHSVLGAAAASVLGHVYGENFRFTFSSPSSLATNPTRTFKSFREAADENGASRVYAGLHFRFAVDAGLKQGRQIGEFAVKTTLVPLRARLSTESKY